MVFRPQCVVGLQEQVISVAGLILAQVEIFKQILHPSIPQER